MTVTSARPPRYSKAHILQYLVSDQCVKCGARMLYHDLDLAHYHNGITCLMCSTEQPLKNGAKSLIDPNIRRAPRSKGGHWGWRRN